MESAGSEWRHCGFDKREIFGAHRNSLDKNASYIIQRKRVNAFFPF